VSLARRAALLAWADRHRAVIIEDDYDSEFRFSDRPLEPLQSLDRTGRVIYVGSFSKTLLPILRLGFLVPPASLQPALYSVKQLSDWHGDPITQGALARFIDEGLLARHIRKATKVYAARRERIVAGIGERLGDWLRVVPAAAGLHVCARLRPEATVEVIAHDLADFCAESPAQQGVVLGFGAIQLDRIGAGLDRLARGFRAADG
jgi:GntR family transcriptional regulator / MocR family aminotransferase